LIILGCGFAVLQAPVRDGLSFDPFSFQQHGLNWSRFTGQSGSPVKVYSDCRSCRQNPVYHILLLLWSLSGCGQGESRSRYCVAAYWLS
jgi:hypothetical protein